MPRLELKAWEMSSEYSSSLEDGKQRHQLSQCQNLHCSCSLDLLKRLDAGRPHFVPTVLVLDERCVYPRMRHTLVSCLRSKCQSGPQPLTEPSRAENLGRLGYCWYPNSAPKGSPPLPRPIHFALPGSPPSSVCVCVHLHTWSLRPQLSPCDKARETISICSPESQREMEMSREFG